MISELHWSVLLEFSLPVCNGDLEHATVDDYFSIEPIAFC